MRTVVFFGGDSITAAISGLQLCIIIVYILVAVRVFYWFPLLLLLSASQNVHCTIAPVVQDLLQRVSHYFFRLIAHRDAEKWLSEVNLLSFFILSPCYIPLG